MSRLKYRVIMFTLLSLCSTSLYATILSCQFDKDQIEAEAIQVGSIIPKNSNEPHFIGINNILSKGFNCCVGDGEMTNAHSCQVIWIRNHWKETLHCMK